MSKGAMAAIILAANYFGVVTPIDPAQSLIDSAQSANDLRCPQPLKNLRNGR